ncbi:hypothetical protein ILYODFUR_013950 [Ilyodon furcidens]|uniref:Uncharacterized protein n=1 Tax=Ilyodon furcidens TaxID=33524 RepID=A0ABV0VGY7_9TELE
MYNFFSSSFFFPLERSPPLFSSLLKSDPHWWVVLFLGQFFYVFGDISVVFYWCVFHMQWEGHQAHPNLGSLSSLLLLFSFFDVFVHFCTCVGVCVCVSWLKERPSYTELARGTKWKRCFRSWRFLAQI